MKLIHYGKWSHIVKKTHVQPKNTMGWTTEGPFIEKEYFVYGHVAPPFLCEVAFLERGKVVSYTRDYPWSNIVEFDAI